VPRAALALREERALRLSVDQGLVGLFGPCSQEFHASISDSLDENVGPEPAGLSAGVSSSDFAASSQGGHHALYIVEALVGLLAGDCALNGVTYKEHPDVDLGVLGELHRVTKGVVGPLATVRALIEDEEYLLRCGAHLAGNLLGSRTWSEPTARMQKRAAGA